MPYSDYLKTRALFFRSHGVSPGVVAKKLKEEGLHASRQGLAKFFRRYDETSSTARRPGSGRRSKLTPDVMQIVEEQMQRDDETTAVQLMPLLAARHRPLSLHYSALSTKTGLDFSRQRVLPTHQDGE